MKSGVPVFDSGKRRPTSGFTLIELMIVLFIFAVILAINFAAYRRYESRYRLYAVSEILAMDLKLQMQRARTLDDQRGIFFYSKTRYALGSHPLTAPLNPHSFVPSNPRREVNLSNEFSGITIESITGQAGFPGSFGYVYFSPRTADASNTWTPMSGFQGEIVISGGDQKAVLTVQSSKEVTITMD